MNAALAALLALACSRRAPEPAPIAGSPAGSATPSIDVATRPTVLLSLPVSAYHASIVVGDDDVAYLLTSTAAHRLAPDRAPAKVPLDLGFGATATPSSFVHWSRGNVMKTPKAGGAPRRLVAFAEPPQLFVAAGETIAWLARSGDGRFSLHAVAGKRPITVYASRGSIDAVAMLDDAIFFVERPAGAAWRIGRVRASGGVPTFTAPQQGRAPAMLAARRDIHYYYGSRFEVRRLSADLQREAALASGFVCSPIAVSEHVYCAQVEGIFELRAGERPRRLVPGSTGRLVTDLAAGAGRLIWVVDAGPDRLEVHTLALPTTTTNGGEAPRANSD
jgi:hypothetical protein